MQNEVQNYKGYKLILIAMKDKNYVECKMQGGSI